MATPDPRDPSNSAPSSAAKATRLVAHLARNNTAALSNLLGSSIMALLAKLGADVTNQTALAYFVVSLHGERGALRRQDVRQLLLPNLEGGEAAELCAVLQLPAFAPLRTLSAIDFDAAPNYLEHLNRWYGVESADVEAATEPTEGSQKAVASHKLHVHQLTAFRGLRRAIGCPPVSVLVHMPFGAGKLRLVATAALDLYRSEADDKTIVWFAPGAAMCEEAFMELQEVWGQLGSRDTTILRLYGDHPTRDLDQLQGSIAVIDIHRLSREDAALEALGSITSVAILGDAEDRIHPVGAEIVQRMSAGGPFSLVGILSIPAAAISEASARESLKQAFPDARITLEPGDDLQTLRRIGDLVDVAGTVVHLMGTSSTDTADGPPNCVLDDTSLDFDPAYADQLGNNVERNERLLSILEQESKSHGRVVFYATTAEQAKLFAGLLPVHGIKARAITAGDSSAGRSLALQKFIARGEKVMCVHGFLLVGTTIPDISVCVFAAPCKSRSAMISTIGRLVQTRAPNLAPLKLIVAADSQADAGWVAALNTWSTLDT